MKDFGRHALASPECRNPRDVVRLWPRDHRGRGSSVRGGLRNRAQLDWDSSGACPAQGCGFRRGVCGRHGRRRIRGERFRGALSGSDSQLGRRSESGMRQHLRGRRAADGLGIRDPSGGQLSARSRWRKRGQRPSRPPHSVELRCGATRPGSSRDSEGAGGAIRGTVPHRAPARTPTDYCGGFVGVGSPDGGSLTISGSGLVTDWVAPFGRTETV